MEMVLTSTCSVCGKKGEIRNSMFTPGFQMPPPFWNHYLPKGWQHIEGVTICPSHTYRIVIERVGQAHGAYRIEIEPEPGAKAQPFQQWMEEKS